MRIPELSAVLATTCCCLLSAEAGEPAAPFEVAVMSFNIRTGKANDGENGWAHRTEAVRDLIRSRKPDVIGVQEAHRFQLDDLAPLLPEYGEIGTARGGGTEDEYSAILYLKARFRVADSGTFWLSDTPGEPSVTWGNACIRICTWARLVERDGGRGFYLFNTHLDHRSQPSREKSVRLIARRIAERAEPEPAVLTGDFNAGEDNPAIRYLTGGAPPDDPCPVRLTDSFRSLHPDAGDTGTYHGFSGRTAGAKIDYVFVDSNTETVAAEIVRDTIAGRYPSDHFPVDAVLRLPAPATVDRAE